VVAPDAEPDRGGVSGGASADLEHRRRRDGKHRQAGHGVEHRVAGRIELDDAGPLLALELVSGGREAETGEQREDHYAEESLVHGGLLVVDREAWLEGPALH